MGPTQLFAVPIARATAPISERLNARMKTRNSPMSIMPPRLSAATTAFAQGRGAVHEHHIGRIRYRASMTATRCTTLRCWHIQYEIRDRGTDDDRTLPPLPNHVTFEERRSMLATTITGFCAFDARLNPYRGCGTADLLALGGDAFVSLNLSPGWTLREPSCRQTNAAACLRLNCVPAVTRPNVATSAPPTDTPTQPIERGVQITPP